MLRQKEKNVNARGYYTPETLGKFADALREARAALEADPERKTAAWRVSVSNGNKKTGPVGSVSLLPFFTCPGVCSGTCGRYCYAAKIALLRPSVLKAYARNTEILFADPAEYWRQVRRAAAGFRFFRFHVAGDIPTAEYLREMIKTAEALPHTSFLAFTKRFYAVNEAVDALGGLPENLQILFSGEENLKPENPHNLPETTIFEDEPDAEPSWLRCGGNCFDCGCAGLGCWQAQRGDVIAFKKH